MGVAAMRAVKLKCHCFNSGESVGVWKVNDPLRTGPLYPVTVA
jgi:hypothetical protein